MQLLQASKQWQSRPMDERMSSLQELRDVCHHYYETAREASATPDQIDVKESGGDLRFVLNAADTTKSARFTHWSFGQLCRGLGMPADYIRTLPTDLAVKNLQHGIERFQKNDSRTPLKLLTHQNGGNILRAITSVNYSRIWNFEVADRLLELGDEWMVPPARPAIAGQPSRKATLKDIVPGQSDFGLSVKVGDEIANAGIYCSDHDLFAFLINPKSRVDDGSGLGLMRGIFVSNSEVGAQSLKITRFKLRAVCGNHICHDVSGIFEVRVVHRGAADARFVKELSIELQRYGEESVQEEQEAIVAAQRYEIGKDKDQVLDTLFGIKNLGLTYKQLDRGYDIAEEHSDVDGSPRSLWGISMGLSRYSQEIPYMDMRARVDRAAGKLLELAK